MYLESGHYDVYRLDLSYDSGPRLGSHWIDRVEAIARDIDQMRTHARAGATASIGSLADLIAAALSDPTRPEFAVVHRPPGRFHPGHDFDLELTVDDQNPLTITLHYRHVDQVEHWESTPMMRCRNRFAGRIPSAYTRNRFSAQYYFVIQESDGRVASWPSSVRGFRGFRTT